MSNGVALPLEQPETTIGAAGGSLVRRSVLPSGVRILSEAMPGARSATVGFWVAAGSRDEAPARPGVDGSPATPSNFGSTHFLEHLLFKGTKTRTALDIAVAFDSVGGEHNALTAKEYTCYYAKIQDRDLPMAVEVIADMVTSSLLDPVEFETERGVILEELAMADDDPADAASERLFEAVFGDHPLGRPIGGSAETIGGATRDAVWAHYRAAYRPNDLVVTVAGAVDHDVLVALLTRVLASDGWDLETPASPVARRVGGSAAFTRGTPLSLVHRPTEQANLLIGFPGLAAADERRMTMGVLNSILGGGMSSRLFQEVREKRGLAYSVYSFAPSYSDAGIFGLYAACTPAKAGTVAELLLTEFSRLAEHGVTADELRRARGQLSGAAALALEDSDTRMSRLGRAELTFGEFVDLDESLRRLALVGADDVQALAADLARGPSSISAVGAVDDSTFAGIAEVESASAV
ncbi:insulinase family protein [Rathayibacter sp. VKM Ac-2803]|uniref:M16 family metallopeptidase n=1 Tax=unclassified Rathayibacter TaxID=2609250 RepID=UPI0013585B53|nr:MULTISPECIES: pitrilysin family protein [unclassified Rathayibacter]MWV49505.1 insulinase family protein [Rathayibacter sp. VKM Ac-2803]MWV60250.1 insulinase family protein [Rathayibacter sp. VKM Ac-2754]